MREFNEFLLQPLKQRLDIIVNFLKAPEPQRSLLGKAREAWESLSFNKRIVYGIMGANIALYGLCCLPRLQVTN